MRSCRLCNHYLRLIVRFFGILEECRLSAFNRQVLAPDLCAVHWPGCRPRCALLLLPAGYLALPATGRGPQAVPGRRVLRAAKAHSALPRLSALLVRMTLHLPCWQSVANHFSKRLQSMCGQEGAEQVDCNSAFLLLPLLDPRCRICQTTTSFSLLHCTIKECRSRTRPDTYESRRKLGSCSANSGAVFSWPSCRNVAVLARPSRRLFGAMQPAQIVLVLEVGTPLWSPFTRPIMKGFGILLMGNQRTWSYF